MPRTPRKPSAPSPQQPPEPAPKKAASSQHYMEKFASGEEFTDHDKMSMASVLGSMLTTEGWSVVQLIIDRLRRETLEKCPYDTQNPPDYHRGRLDMISEIGGAVTLILEEGIALQQHETAKAPATLDDVKRRIRTNFNPGGGGFRGTP